MLERNWDGTPNSSNTVIPQTLQLLQSLVEGGRNNVTDWRALMYLKRAYYDAYVQRRYVHEVEVNEAEAWAQLHRVVIDLNSTTALEAARTALNLPDAWANQTSYYRQRVLEIAATLIASIGADVWHLHLLCEDAFLHGPDCEWFANRSLRTRTYP